jgi:hypothetical protein
MFGHALLLTLTMIYIFVDTQVSSEVKTLYSEQMTTGNKPTMNAAVPAN